MSDLMKKWLLLTHNSVLVFAITMTIATLLVHVSFISTLVLGVIGILYMMLVMTVTTSRLYLKGQLDAKSIFLFVIVLIVNIFSILYLTSIDPFLCTY